MGCIFNFSRVSWREKSFNFVGVNFINFYLLLICILGLYLRNHCWLQIVTMQKLHFFSVSFGPLDLNRTHPAPWRTHLPLPSTPTPFISNPSGWRGAGILRNEPGLLTTAFQPEESQPLGLSCVSAPAGPRLLETDRATPGRCGSRRHAQLPLPWRWPVSGELGPGSLVPSATVLLAPPRGQVSEHSLTWNRAWPPCPRPTNPRLFAEDACSHWGLVRADKVYKDLLEFSFLRVL